MKIIDILNKIANGEEVPNKVSFLDKEYEYHKDHMDYFDSNWGSLFQRIIDEYYEWLDLEVEILETTITYKPDKIEKIEPFKEEVNITEFAVKYPEVAKVLKSYEKKIAKLIEVVNKL